MSTEELRREVLVWRRNKRRLVIAMVVALVLATHFAVGWLVRPDERVRVEHTQSTVTSIVTVPVAMTVEREVNRPLGRASCPPPRRDAPFVAPAKTPERVERVRPSRTNAGWIAAWNEEQVFISVDAGASWQRRLDGKGKVLDVGFDCFGRAIVVRESGVGIRDGETEMWKPVPDLALVGSASESGGHAAVIGGGPDIVLVGIRLHTESWSSRLAISRDNGATWELRDLQDYWEGGAVAGRQYEDGSIVAMQPISDCGGDSPWLFTYADGKVSGSYAQVRAELAIFGDRVVASDGWQKLGGDVEEFVAPPEERMTVLEGPYPIFVGNSAAYRWDNNRFTQLPWKLPSEASSYVADPAGRIWSVACGMPWIATRSGDAPLCDCDGP